MIIGCEHHSGMGLCAACSAASEGASRREHERDRAEEREALAYLADRYPRFAGKVRRALAAGRV